MNASYHTSPESGLQNPLLLRQRMFDISCDPNQPKNQTDDEMSVALIQRFMRESQIKPNVCHLIA